MTDTTEAHQTRRENRLALSVISNWGGLVLGVGISFFLSPFVVRKLGSTWYGIWAVTMQLTGYLYLLDFGVRESVIRYTSKYLARGQNSRLNGILGVALRVYGGITLAALLITAAFVWMVPSLFSFDASYYTEARLALAFVGMTIAQTFVFNVYTGIMLGLQRWTLFNFINIATTIVRTALIVVALQANYGIVALAAIQFLSSVTSGIITWRLATRYLREAGAPIRFGHMTRRRFRALAGRVFAYGFFVFLSNIGQKIIVASDALVIAAFLPVSSVAYYAIAGSLVEPLRSLLISSAQVFAPLASSMDATGDRKKIGQAMTTASKYIVILALPVATTYVILGRRFIGLWMGDEFAGPAGDVLVILGLTAIIAAPSYVVGMVLYGISRHSIAGYVKIVEAAANLALSVWLVQKMGIVGVALGTAIPHIAACIIVLPYIACREVGYSFWRFIAGVFRGPLMAILPFALAELWVRQNLTINSLPLFFAVIAALSAGYVLTVFWVALHADERMWVYRRIGFGGPVTLSVPPG